MKKLLSVLALSATLLVGCAGATNNNGIKESAFDGLRNETQQVAVRAGQIGSDATGAHSQTYVQYGKNDSNEYVVRFATAVKGEISSLSYSRAAVGELEAATFDVTTVYRGIEAGDSVYYYDGTDLTTDETYAGNYYWACYTIAYSSSKHFATEIDVTFAIDGIDVNEKKSSLAEICTDCEVVGHKWEREGTLKATSLTKGSNIKICGVCGHEEISELDFDPNNSAVLEANTEDKEVSSTNLVRGLKGNFTLKFKYNTKATDNGTYWNMARVVFLDDDIATYTGTNAEIYGKALACPGDANTHNGAYYLGYTNNVGNCWMTDGTTVPKMEDHILDMDVEVTVKREGDFVFTYLDGQSNVDKAFTNHNEFHFYIPGAKTMNVVLTTTKANVSLSSASLTLDDEVSPKSTTGEMISTPVTFNGDNGGYSSQQKIYQGEIKGERVVARVKFNTKSATAKSNAWGSWRISLWGNYKTDENGNVLSPHPYSENQYNGSLLARVTPAETSNDWRDWNSMKPISDTLKWYERDGAGGFNFAQLMQDCDVTLTIAKLGRYVMINAIGVSNVDAGKGAVTSKNYVGYIPAEANEHVSFSVDGEQSDIVVSSCVIENY